MTTARLILTMTLIVGTALFYFVVIRPFSVGFDLASVAARGGVAMGSVRIGTLARPPGQAVRHQIQGVEALLLNGDHAGSTATLQQMEQYAQSHVPFVQGLDVTGQGKDALFIGFVEAGAAANTFEISETVRVRWAGQALEAARATLDTRAQTLETEGPTQVRSDTLDLQTDQGLRVDRDGDLTIGKRP